MPLPTKATNIAPVEQPSGRSRKVSTNTTGARSTTSTSAPSFTSHGRAGSTHQSAIPLPRRLLFPQQPVQSPLPPLFLSLPQDSPGVSELTDEAYSFLALALRGFVSPWWTKITPRDKEFLHLITTIVTTFIQRLEQRLADADIPSLICRDLPTVITQHYKDFRQASSKLGTSYAGASDASIPHMFHQLQPHMAISEDGTVNETYLRQAVEHVMRACLPANDWEPEVERAIIREIVVRPVLGAVFSRLTQPWFLHVMFLNLLGSPKERRPDPPKLPGPVIHKSPISFHGTLILFFKAVQAVSTFCLAFIAFVQHIRQVVHTVNSAPSSHSPKMLNRSDLARPPLDMIAEIFTMRKRASSGAVLSILEIGTGFLSPFLDRLIPHVIYNSALTPYRLSTIVSQAKKTLFPNGYPGPPPVEPTPSEQLVLREQLEVRLMEIFPSASSPFLLGSDLPTSQRTISSVLDPLSFRECNAHLLIFILDVILLRVFPEIGAGNGDNVSSDGAEEAKSPIGDLDSENGHGFGAEMSDSLSPL